MSDGKNWSAVGGDKDVLEEDPEMEDEDIYEFIEDNYQNIIEDTLDEFQEQDENPVGEEDGYIYDADSDLDSEEEEGEEDLS